jgi:hypothetical protein
MGPPGTAVFEIGIAQYIPARANTVSKTSIALFMGESPARKSRAWRSICPIGRGGNLWIIIISGGAVRSSVKVRKTRDEHARDHLA